MRRGAPCWSGAGPVLLWGWFQAIRPPPDHAAAEQGDDDYAYDDEANYPSYCEPGNQDKDRKNGYPGDYKDRCEIH
jgi:hypothetical protein